jgi:lipoprotein NlpD
MVGALLLAIALIVSCSVLPVRSDRPKGIYHRVKSGETLYAIAKAYNIKVGDLAEINHIENPDVIVVDRVIFIPDVNQIVDNILVTARSEASQQTQSPPSSPAPLGQQSTDPLPNLAKHPVDSGAGIVQKKLPSEDQAADTVKSSVKPSPPPYQPPRVATPPVAGPEVVKQKPVDRPTEPAERKTQISRKEEPKQQHFLRADKGRFIWPVQGRIISKFGEQPNRMQFNGIRIAATQGSVILAAARGSVIYSDYVKGYGETIIIEHDDNYATVYTNLDTRTVTKKQSVKQGDRIAFLGRADNQEEPYLHFEIRQKYKALDPMLYLP